MTFVTSEMVVLSVIVSSRIPTKSVQIVHVMTFFGSGISKNNFWIRISEFGFSFFVKLWGEQLNTHTFLILWTFCIIRWWHFLLESRSNVKFFMSIELLTTSFHKKRKNDFFVMFFNETDFLTKESRSKKQ